MYLLVALVVASGFGLSVQAGVNARLGRMLGSPLIATLVSVVVSTLSVALVAAVSKAPVPTAAAVARVPAWAWIGGFFGAFYVAMAIIATPRLGVATTVGLVVGGQMLMSLLIDHFGWFGLDRHPVSVTRLAGVALLVAGALLIRR
jgi:transporter family-2 protein